MNHWFFILAAYGATILGAAGVALWSWTAMRRAEADAEALGRPR